MARRIPLTAAILAAAILGGPSPLLARSAGATCGQGPQATRQEQCRSARLLASAERTHVRRQWLGALRVQMAKRAKLQTIDPPLTPPPAGRVRSPGGLSRAPNVR